MKRFFSNLFSKKKEDPKPTVVQVSLVAERRYWRSEPNRNFKFLDHWNRPTFLPLTLDLPSGRFWSDLIRLQNAARMTISYAEAYGGFWDFYRERSHVMENVPDKKVLFRVWPSAKFLDPASADFYDAVCLAANSGQPIEIFCKWAPED